MSRVERDKGGREEEVRIDEPAQNAQRLVDKNGDELIGYGFGLDTDRPRLQTINEHLLLLTI